MFGVLRCVCVLCVVCACVMCAFFLPVHKQSEMSRLRVKKHGLKCMPQYEKMCIDFGLSQMASALARRDLY